MAAGKRANYAFIDGSNLYLGIRSLGWRLDYKRFRIFLKESFGVATAYLFLGLVAENSAMYRDLQSWGYTIVFKPTLRDGDNRIKGNCDAELVLQAMIDFDDYESAILVTGDGDFSCLTTYLEKECKLGRLLAPTAKDCSSLLKRSIPRKILYLERFRQQLELKVK